MKIVRVLALAMGFAQSGIAPAVTVGQPFPDLTIKSFTSGDLNAKTLKGKVTIVNFWATWCASCKVELKEMEEKFAGILENKNVNVAFVSVDKDPQAAAQWIKSHMKASDKFISKLYQDPEFELAEKLSLDSFPMTFVIGPDGTVRHVQRGFVEGKPSTDEIVKVTKAIADNL